MLFSGSDVDLAKDAVNIKGTKNGLVILFNPSLDIEEVKRHLTMKMESSGEFLRGAKFSVFDSSTSAKKQYVNELEGICREYGLVPSGEITWPPSGREQGNEKRPRKNKSQVIPLRQEQGADLEEVLLLTRTVRSGQSIFSRCSVVILADVNPGSEVRSEGSVYIIGKCLGSIHAGCAGNIMSEIFALRLNPVILRIGTVSADTVDFAAIAGPGTARVSKGKMIFIPGNPNNNNLY